MSRKKASEAFIYRKQTCLAIDQSVSCLHVSSSNQNVCMSNIEHVRGILFFFFDFRFSFKCEAMLLLSREACTASRQF